MNRLTIEIKDEIEITWKQMKMNTQQPKIYGAQQKQF